MSAALESRAEIVKLARLLGTEPGELSYLETLPPEQLRSIRLGATDVLFDGDRAMMARLAAGAKLLPAGVLATIAEKVFGPLLCARIAGYVDPGKAVEVASKLSPRFLADVAKEIDPRKASVVIGRIPPKQAAAVAEILTNEDEFVTMGRFVGHLEDPAIEACMKVIADEKLLSVAFMLEEKQRLDHVMGLLSDERAANVARHAAGGEDWAEALDLAEHVSPEQTRRLADIVAAQDDDVLTSLVEAAGEAELWAELLPLSRAMSPGARERFAAVEELHRPEVLERVVEATVEHDLWEELLPLLPALPEPAQRDLAEIAARGDGVIGTAAQRAVELDLWEPLLDLAGGLGVETRAEIADVLLEADDEALRSLVAAIDETGAWDRLSGLFEGLGEERLDRVRSEAERLGAADRLAVALGSS